MSALRSKYLVIAVGATSLVAPCAAAVEAAATAAPTTPRAEANDGTCVSDAEVDRLTNTSPDVVAAQRHYQIAKSRAIRASRAEARALAVAQATRNRVTPQQHHIHVQRYQTARTKAAQARAAAARAKHEADRTRTEAHRRYHRILEHALCSAQPTVPVVTPTPTPTVTVTVTPTPTTTTTTPTTTPAPTPTPPAPTTSTTPAPTTTTTPAPTTPAPTTTTPAPTTTTTPAPTTTTPAPTTTTTPAPTTTTTPAPTTTTPAPTTTTPAPTTTTPAPTTTTPAPTTPAPSLAAPTGLTAGSATSLSTGALRLSWTASTGATSYSVYRSGTLLGTTASTTYTPSSTTLNAFDSYTVRASNGTTTSADSAALVAGPFQGTAAADKRGVVTYGQIQVTIVVTSGASKSTTGCWATYPTTSDSGPINTSAIPKLCTQVITKQPVSATAATLITNVSGASATSPAFKTSLQAALVLAGM